MKTASISTLRKIAIDKSEDGHISAADAKALVKAAGKGPTAAKNLAKILDQFAPVFTKAGKAEMTKALGQTTAPDKPAAEAKITEATRRALLKTLAAARQALGTPMPSLPLGQRLVEVPLYSEKHIDGFSYSAVIPVGAMAPKAPVSDPNKAKSCYIKRTGGFAGLTQYFGPFDIQRGRATKAVEIGEADSGKKIEVKKGQDVVVSLPANITTGYTWKVTSTDRTFGYPATEDYITADQPGRIGGGGVAKLTWKTNSPVIQTGQTHTVTIEYKRGVAGTPAKRFALVVEIV